MVHSWEERVEGNKITEVQRSEHIYDGENRIKSQSWSVGGNTQRSESYTYSTVDGTLTNMTTANGETITFGYDKLKRLESVSGVTGQTYTYRDLNNEQTTTQIADITYTGVTDKLKLSYAYDAGGNIDTIRQSDGPNAEQDEGTIIAQYAYDVQNQLVEERLPNVTYEYVYDTGYNLRQVKTYRNGSSTPEITTYEYGNTDWLDLLTKYNGQQITYDTIGNPLTYNNGTAWTFTWQGAHDLATATANGKQIAFHYDMDGVRDSKTVNGVKHEYITQGGNVTLERWNDGEAKSLEFIYDNGGAPYSVIYTHGDSDPEIYYYVLNQQGDVIRIVNGSGATVAEYTYNGWGEILSVNNKIGTFGTLNPIRYRGYYYDTELNMYYLQSRYYDPVVKRMLSADDESLTAGASLNDNNLFTYCDNNPVNRADADGEFWHIVAGAVVGATISGIVSFAGGDRGLDLASSIATGAVSGALSATTASRAALVLANATLSAAASVATDIASGGKINLKNAALSATVSGISAAVGGAGTGSKSLMKSGTQSVKSTIKAVRGSSKKGTLNAIKNGTKKAVKAAKYYAKSNRKYYASNYGIKSIAKNFVTSISEKVSQCRAAKKLYKKIYKWIFWRKK